MPAIGQIKVSIVPATTATVARTPEASTLQLHVDRAEEAEEKRAGDHEDVVPPAVPRLRVEDVLAAAQSRVVRCRTLQRGDR
jgi:hypothetical protein